MLDKETHLQACLILIVVFLILSAVSLYGFFYGLSMDYDTYIWAGAIVTLVSIAIVCLVIWAFIMGRRRFIKEEKENKNEDEDS